MKNRGPALALTAVLVASCSEDRGANAAMQVVDELQQALRAGDRSRCRDLVTSESALALAELPWQQLRTKRPLEVIDAAPDLACYRVRVRDPNDGDRVGEILVVREYGRVVVDLVATAGLTAEFTERPASGPEFAPRELSAADFDRIRQQQLATPPR